MLAGKELVPRLAPAQVHAQDLRQFVRQVHLALELDDLGGRLESCVPNMATVPREVREFLYPEFHSRNAVWMKRSALPLVRGV